MATTSLDLSGYISSDDEALPAHATAVASSASENLNTKLESAPSPQPGKSFFSADDAELSDSGDEGAGDEEAKDWDSDEDTGKHGQKQAANLPSVKALFSSATPKPEFLHRAAIYNVKEIQTFDKRLTPERPKPWLKQAAGSGGSGALGTSGSTSAITRGSSGVHPVAVSVRGDHGGTHAPPHGVEDGGTVNEGCSHLVQPTYPSFAAQEATAAAMSLRKTYKNLAPIDDGEKPKELVPICELNQMKRQKTATKKGDGEMPMSFREREKRKRDLGMQSRDKSYVEEEKRILRESMLPTFGQGFD